VATTYEIHAIWVELQNTTVNFKITNERMKWQNLSPLSRWNLRENDKIL